MSSIQKEVTEIKEKEVGNQLLRNSRRPAGSLASSSTGQNIMMGFDDVLLEIMDKLTGGQPDRQIIPIVGMGGAGKTTLAKNIYVNPLIKEHFDIRAWASISQEYSTQEILREVLCRGNKAGMADLRENRLGETVHKHLSYRRYLIILDDMWNIDAWDEVQWSFPDNRNGSRIIITTRLSKLAFQLAQSYVLQMKFLDEDNSWILFSDIVFGKECCPIDLEEIGKKIVKSCRGLPLSIVVIGGLLSRSKHSQEDWEYIEKNLNSIVNSEDDEHCLKILHMSYTKLPVHLKSCFLYMGVFKEDRVIRVSTLVKLWVAEGFIKPTSGKILEEIAKEYLKELIDRNLVIVHKLGSTGNIKLCCIHGLLRDLCLGEARKERFYKVIKQDSLDLPQSTNNHRRIVIPESTSEENVCNALQSMSFARSLICDFRGNLPLLKFRLLRILKTLDGYLWRNGSYLLENIFQLVNSRYLDIGIDLHSEFPSSIYLLWNLHTLIVDCFWELTAPIEIWKMPQLRHVIFKGRVYLPDPPSYNVGGLDDIVLEGLQTLSIVYNFKFSEEVVKRIPNIKKLKILYKWLEGKSSYCPNHLDRLHKLESLGCSFSSTRIDFTQDLTFPDSLKKLTLEANCSIIWDDMLAKISSLPHLEKLRLFRGSFRNHKWETVERQFRSLKFLEIDDCIDLAYWTTESSHFPCLEHLVLRNLPCFEVIPSDIGEIPTLRLIELDKCKYSAVISAKGIQEELGEGLQVRVIHDVQNEELETLASPNFQIEYSDH